MSGDINVLDSLVNYLTHNKEYTYEDIIQLIQKTNICGKTILHEAAQHGVSGFGNLQMVKFLLQNYFFAPENDVKTLPDSISHSLDPRARENTGYNGLHHAFVKGNRHTDKEYNTTPTIKYLHELGLDINTPAIGFQSYIHHFNKQNRIELHQKISNLTQELERYHRCKENIKSHVSSDNILLQHINNDIREKNNKLIQLTEEQERLPQKAQKQYPRFDTIKQWITEIVKEFELQLQNHNLDNEDINFHKSKIDVLKDKIAKWYDEKAIIVHTPLSIAIMFGNKEGVKYALENGALFDISASTALEKLSKPEGKNYDRYEEVNSLISDKIKNNSLQILKNTQQIFCNIDLEKYFESMTYSIQKKEEPNKYLNETTTATQMHEQKKNKQQDI